MTKSTVCGSPTSRKTKGSRSKVARLARVRLWTFAHRCRAAGTRVHRGQTLVILEAMKMQNEIPAPGDGVVRQVAVAEGETITADRVVASIELGGPSAS